MRKELYQFIKSAIDQIPEVKHFGLWNNKVYTETVQPFVCPAVFLEISPIAWNLLGNNIRESTVTFALHIVSESKTGKWEEVEAILQLIDTITKKLHLLTKLPTDNSPVVLNSIICTSSTTDNDFGKLMHNIEHYKCYIRDGLLIKKSVLSDNLNLDIITSMMT